jgi:hypothetical protein
METLDALKLKPEELTQFVLKTIERRPLSKSSLSQFATAPRYYIEYLLGERKEKEVWLLGKVVECLLLESTYDFDSEKWDKSVFDKKFLIAEKPDLRSPKNKEIWQQLLQNASENKLTMISQGMNDQAELMAITTLQNPNCKMWLDKKQNIQKVLRWKDKSTGLPVIGVIDFEAEFDGHKTIVDNKVSRRLTEDEFNKDVYGLGYNYQIGSYLLGYHNKYFQFPDFVFMVSTNVFPYDSYVVHVPGDLANESKEEFKNLLVAFKYCIEHNQFHMGADFWLFETMPYHSLRKPGYYKPKMLIE